MVHNTFTVLFQATSSKSLANTCYPRRKAKTKLKLTTALARNQQQPLAGKPDKGRNQAWAYSLPSLGIRDLLQVAGIPPPPRSAEQKNALCRPTPPAD